MKPSATLLEFFSAHKGEVVSLADVVKATGLEAKQAQGIIANMLRKEAVTLEVRMRGNSWYIPSTKDKDNAVLAAPVAPPAVEKPKRKAQVEPAAPEPPQPIKEHVFEIVGVISESGGMLGLGKAVRVVRDPENGRLYKLVAL